MKIKINNKFYIDVDTTGNHILTEICEGKKKETEETFTYEKTHGFFSSVRLALEKYIKLDIASKHEIMEIKEYLKEFRRQLQHFKEKLEI